jgi:DNA-binding IclR family transcriptional regulator
MSAGYAARTIAALELIASGPVSAVGAADALGVDARTARRLLDRLAVERVLVRRVGRGRRYSAGPRLLSLAAEVILGAPDGVSPPPPASPRSADRTDAPPPGAPGG